MHQDQAEFTHRSCRDTSPSNNPLGNSVILFPYRTLQKTETAQLCLSYTIYKACMLKPDSLEASENKLIEFLFYVHIFDFCLAIWMY